VLELAARWVLDRPGISVALWGAKRPEQLDAVAGVLGWKLDFSAMVEIDRIVAESVTDPVGPDYLGPRVRRTETPAFPPKSKPVHGSALRYWFVMPIADLQQAAQKIAGFLAT